MGIDTEKFRPGNSRKENYVIGISSYGWPKGIDRAIETISRIPVEKRPKLMWFGNLPEGEYIDSLKRTAEELKVVFIPKYNMQDEEIIACLQKAVVMIYLPFLEPFGLVPLEANACGTAVVGIAEGGLRETIIDTVNGYTVKDYDCDEIALKIPLVANKRSIVEQYFGLSHLHTGAKRARFTTIFKNVIDAMFRQMAFNLFRGSKIIPAT